MGGEAPVCGGLDLPLPWPFLLPFPRLVGVEALDEAGVANSDPGVLFPVDWGDRLLVSLSFSDTWFDWAFFLSFSDSAIRTYRLSRVGDLDRSGRSPFPARW